VANVHVWARWQSDLREHFIRCICDIAYRIDERSIEIEEDGEWSLKFHCFF
jgi:hypothetical protein